MQKSVGFILRGWLTILFVTPLLFALNANAQEGGGGGAYKRFEPFTVNLVGMQQVIQLSITLKLASPAADAKVSLYLPAVRHAMILLLSAKTAEQIETSVGKQQLIKEAKVAINKAIELDAKEGVADVLIESIIIQ